MNNNHWYKDCLLIYPLTLEDYSRQEVLTKLGSLLCQNGFVKESYINAIIEREEEYPTGLPTNPGVAIPHTDADHVKELALAVAILDKPVQFFEMGSGKNKIVDVQIVFALSVPDPKEVIQRLQMLFSVIQDPSFLKNLIGLCNRTEVSTYLNQRLNISLWDGVSSEMENVESYSGKKHVEKMVVIKHPIGLHARPASLFVQTAKQFQSQITVSCNERKANAKSIISVLQLGASQGSKIYIQAMGEDQDQAVQALYRLVENNFSENSEKVAYN